MSDGYRYRMWLPLALVLRLGVFGICVVTFLGAESPAISSPHVEGPVRPDALRQLRPSMTQRARTARPKPSEPEPGLDAQAPSMSLFVPVGEARALHRNFQLATSFSPSHWFPAPDEAPIPESDCADALQRHSRP